MRAGLGATSILLVLVVIVLATVTVAALDAARHALALFTAATVIATLLTPPVGWLGRWLPRPLAVVVVGVLTLGVAGTIVYGVAQDIDAESRRLQQVAPEAAARLEASPRLGELARDFRLTERVEDAVDELRARATAEASDAARRSGSYLVGAVFTLFMLSWGPRLADAGLEQITDPTRRRRAARVLAVAVERARRYVIGSLVQAVAIGGAVAVALTVLDVPAPAALGAIVATASLVPFVGVVVGAIPALLIAAGLREVSTVLALLAVVAVLQALQIAVLHRHLVGRSLYVGPAVVVVSALVGWEAFRAGGALFAAALAVFAVALLDAAAQLDAAEIADVPVGS